MQSGDKLAANQKRLIPKSFITDGVVPEWLLRIKPDYTNIRKRHLRICLITAILVFLVENFMFFVYCQDPEAYGGFKQTIPMYLLIYNVIPSTINFASVLIAWLVVRKSNDELVRNYAPIAAFTIICTVTASAHSLYSITLSVMMLPIIMVSIFGVREMNMTTSFF